MSKGHRKRKQGFTFLEVMVGVFVLTLGVAGSYVLMVYVVQGTSFSGRMTAASALGQEKMEELREIAYADLDSGQDTASLYDRAWTVLTRSNHKDVDVTVSWSDAFGQGREIALSTKIKEPKFVAGLPDPLSP